MTTFEGGPPIPDKIRLASAVTRTLVDMRFDAVSDLFKAHGTGSPTIIWSPSPYDFSQAVIKRFAACTTGNGAQSKCLTVREFEHLNTQDFEPWMMVLEPSTDCSDFRYLKYGSEIAIMFGRDMTGHRTSELGGHISDFFIALYTAVVIRKETVLSVHEPPSDVFATTWRRLIIPLVDEVGRVCRLAAVNVPDNELRAGMDALPDPALVVRPDGMMVYSNSHARRIFGDPSAHRVQISDYCDMAIDLPESAEKMLRDKTFVVSRSMGVQNQVLVHFEVRVSATFYREKPYFVIILKPH